jgi:voltage-gated potassium channel
MAQNGGGEKIMGLKPRTWRHVSRAVRSGRIVLYLSATTILLAVAAAVVMRLSDNDAFPTIGISLWWAIVTLTTVGYGDVVPSDALGRTVGAVLMTLGVTYIAFMTAVITSVLISADTARLTREAEREGQEMPGTEPELHAVVRRIEQRLERIESKLPD